MAAGNGSLTSSGPLGGPRLWVGSRTLIASQHLTTNVTLRRYATTSM
jgi:hypothetical protein